MKLPTMNELRAAHPALAGAKTCRLVGVHQVSGTDRLVPRVVCLPGRTVDAVATELALRVGDRSERNTEAYQDAATVAIDDGDGGVCLAVPR